MAELNDTVRDKMNENRSLVERIALYIPIYRGYRQKNLRRDEDRAVRQEVARVLSTAKDDLVTIQRATVGNLQLMRDTDRILAKADKYYIEVKKGAGGYSAFHDSVKILEAELDQLIEWDARLIDTAQDLKALTESTISRIDLGECPLPADIRDLERLIDGLIEEYNSRETVMRGFVADEPGEEAPVEAVPAGEAEEPKKKKGLFGWRK